MRFVSLFSGIGGIDLGLERAGMTGVAQVENDPWCNEILEKHWPDVPRWQDIHDLDPEELPDHDLIAGGFPCQPVSLAGARLAQDDPRWLWPEFFRIVRLVRPRYVLVENVPGLASAGMGDVLGDLASVGYDCEWQSIPAAFVGAPHLRQRIFIVAYPKCDGRNGNGFSGNMGEPQSTRSRSQSQESTTQRTTSTSGLSSQTTDAAYPADSRSVDVRRRRQDVFGARKRDAGDAGPLRSPAPTSDAAHPDRHGEPGGPSADSGGEGSQRDGLSGSAWDGDWWSTEPDVGRVADGVPRRVDRLRGLGNAVVPQVAELVGRMILEANHVA